MIRARHIIFWLLIGLIFSGCAASVPSQEVYFVDRTARVCPASDTDRGPPDLADCETVGTESVNPQDGHIWAVFNLRLPDSFLDSYDPLGFGIIAKASSWTYINGREVGRNGTPASAKASEITGQMDVAFPLREGILKAGDNQVAVRLSSHAGIVQLRNPVHAVYVAKYERPQARLLRQYAPSLLPFGVFILGALYFLIMSVVGRRRDTAALLAVLSAVIACQLFAEVSRGIFAYAYPWHDIRLIVILTCSALFGAGLSLYVARIFASQNTWRWAAIIGLMLAATLIIPQGFDVKSSATLLSQTVLGLVIAGLHIRRQRIKSLAFIAALSLFAAIIIIAPGRFLDVYFFYAIALLMLFLFTQQALAHGEEQKIRQQEEIRANQLQLVLDQRAEESVILSLSEAGKIYRVEANDIVALSGAGDYVEVRLASGKMRLASATLAELEIQLPSIFLRVHRSHIVNTSFIQALDRDASGTGQLRLTTEHTVPVSRRILPKVRKALA